MRNNSRSLDYLEAAIIRGKNEPGDVNINIYSKITTKKQINVHIFRNFGFKI